MTGYKTVQVKKIHKNYLSLEFVVNCHYSTHRRMMDECRVDSTLTDFKNLISKLKLILKNNVIGEITSYKTVSLRKLYAHFIGLKFQINGHHETSQCGGASPPLKPRLKIEFER